jgi:two-component system response regulator HydG
MQAYEILGTHPLVRAIADAAERLARSRTAVAVVGERGTGKELLARYLHASTDRSPDTFVRIDCCEGSQRRLEHELFERDGGWRRASHGTLLLDELPSLPIELQLRLRDSLREAGAPRERHHQQIVATLTREVTAEMRAGRLAEELVASLQPVEIVLPALRQRRVDVPLLVQHFLGLYGARHGVGHCQIETEALVYLWQYDWPGNVRELESVIERVVVLCPHGVIRVGDLPAAVRTRSVRGPGGAPTPPRAGNGAGPQLRPTI